MIDLETLSTKPNAVILTIGAVAFEPCGDDNSSSFYSKIDLGSYKTSFDVDLNTVCWWSKQSDAAREEAFQGSDRVPLAEALTTLCEWIPDNPYVWANGSAFDIPIIEHAFHVCDIKVPWKYYNVRDTRTLYSLAGVSLQTYPVQTAHKAIDDCYRQILAVRDSYKILNKIE